MLGPLFEWEVRRISRRRRYYALRTFYLLALLAAYLWVYAVMSWEASPLGRRAVFNPARFAQSFFDAYSIAQLTAILLLTPAFVAPAVAAEKQQKILEALLTTDLTSWEIIVGKWASRTLQAAVLVLIGIPVICLAGLLGGVDFERLAVLSVVSIGCLASTSALALATSVAFPTVRSALLAAYLAIFVFLVTPFALDRLVEISYGVRTQGAYILNSGAEYDYWKRWCRDLVSAHPFLIHWQSSRSAVARWDWLGTFALIHLTSAFILLTFSIFWLRRTTHVVVRRRRTKFIGARKRPIGRWPIFSREWNSGAGSRRWMMRLAVSTVVYGGIWTTHRVFPGQLGVGIVDALASSIQFVGPSLLYLGLLLTAVRSANSITIERERETLLSLMTTPLSAGEIIWGKAIASLKPLFEAWVFLLPLAVCAAQRNPDFIYAFAAATIFVSVYGAFVAGVGIYNSLKRQSGWQAQVITLATVVVGSFLGWIPAIGIGTLVFLMLKFNFGDLLWILFDRFEIDLAFPPALIAYMFRVEKSANWGASNLFFATLFAGPYALAGLSAIQIAIREFNEYAGRSDGGKKQRLARDEIVGLSTAARIEETAAV